MCEQPRPIYVAHSKEGINGVVSRGDGYTITIDWTQAYPDTLPYQVIYNIYYSTILDDVFTEGVKGVSLTWNPVEILELTPGDTFYFAVRATQYDPVWYNPALLPDGFPGLKVYPEAMLLSNLGLADTSILISDIGEFPSMGIVQIGQELIQYSGKDVPSNSLVGASRGFQSTNIRFHQTDGYDGYETQDPFVRFWKGFEESNVTVHQSTSRFAYPNYARTNADGYRRIRRDLFDSELSGSDADTDDVVQPLPGSNDSQVNFQPYDYSGYHRTDPVALLNGDCIGTYYGGEQFCADGYGVGFQVRGLPLNQANDQRQEELLSLTGEPVVLVRRLTTGIQCNCMEASTQNPSLRCPNCWGTGFVGGYTQYFNPRRSDGRIMVRFSPTDEDIKIEDDGFESAFLPDCWTLVVPAMKSRDFIIRYREDEITEEFRYEVLTVNRNKLITSLSGGQKFKAQRVRKTDPIYQWSAIASTATIPQTVSTSIGMVAGPGGIAPHVHNIVINEGILTFAQVNQTTSVARGHVHEVRNGIVMPALNHFHTIVLP